MWGFILSMVSGALMSIQGVMNTSVTEKTSLWVAAGWVQLTAFLTCAAAWLFTGRPSVRELFQVEPRYLLLGGVIGAAITGTVIQGMKMLKPAGATLLIVTTQLAASYLIELMGWFGAEQTDFQWRKLLGIAVAAAGIIIFQK